MNKLLSFISGIEKNININRHIKKNYPYESLYMRGKYISNDKNHSIFYFTVHRCASRYVSRIIKQLMSNSGRFYIDLAGYLWHGGKMYRKDTDVYRRYGYVYGPFYGLEREELDIPVSDFKGFKVLLMLRDPRDVLTSYYFHHAFDPYHNPAKQDYIHNRSRKSLNMTIDEWVLEKIPIFKLRYKEYIDKFYGKPNVLFMKYENMISDFNEWLHVLIEFMDLHPEPEIIESIRKKTDFSVNKEDVKSHKRQVTPGDHMRKLREDTVKVLNSEFGEILSQLKYI